MKHDAPRVCPKCRCSRLAADWLRDKSGHRAKHCGCSSIGRETKCCEGCGRSFAVKTGGRPKRWCDLCRGKARQQQRNEYKADLRRKAGRPMRKHDAHVKAWMVERQRKPALHDAHVRALWSDRAALARWKMRTNPEYVLHLRMRVAIRKALKGGKAGRRWEGLVGYDVRTLANHLKCQLPKGKTLDDLFGGRLHIDHIIPKSMFDVTKPEELRACWALSNLRPLRARDNQRKGDKRTHLI